MKILYVILSCDKYKDTRQKWQRETWLKNALDLIYLNTMPQGMEETYINAPYKYLAFLIAWDWRQDYDWFFFCDDDTYVYTDKLESFLKHHSGAASRTMIGFKGGEFKIYNLSIPWCSGGAGIALSRIVVQNIQQHLRSTPHPLVTDETDISLAIWATMSTQDLFVIDSKEFSPFNPDDARKEGMKDCITYHYCTENDFIRLSR